MWNVKQICSIRASFGIPQKRSYGMTDAELAVLELKVSKTCHALFLFSLSYAIDIHTKQPPKEKKTWFIFSSIFSATGPNVIFLWVKKSMDNSFHFAADFKADKALNWIYHWLLNCDTRPQADQGSNTLLYSGLAQILWCNSLINPEKMNLLFMVINFT